MRGLGQLAGHLLILLPSQHARETVTGNPDPVTVGRLQGQQDWQEPFKSRGFVAQRVGLSKWGKAGEKPRLASSGRGRN